MFQVFDYDDVLLVPRKCQVNSRSECSTDVIFGPRTFRLPVVPANMRTVISVDTCKWLAAHGYFYVMHRFDVDALQFVREMHRLDLYASISLGVKPEDQRLVKAFAKHASDIPEYITIDIAHGHADSVRDMIQLIKHHLPTTFVIAGNVGTPDAVIDLESWGADATKVGIGPGKVCITKLKTGFGTGGWQLGALHACAQVAKKPLVADGGIRSHGDIAKSVRFGASMVMIGSLLAGLEESPGQTVEVDGQLFKEYYGSASQFNKGEHRHVEGKRILEPLRGTFKDTLQEMQEDLQSAISYSGGTALEDLRRVDFVLLGAANANRES